MNRIKKKLISFLDAPYLSWVVVSFVIYFVVETVNQKTIGSAFLFIFRSPLAFLLNLGIVMLSFSAALFIRKRLFNYIVVSILWIIVAVINMVLLVQRNTQFNASDILIFRYGVFITIRYLSILHFILIGCGLTVLAAFSVYMFRNGYKTYRKPNVKISGIVLVSLTVLVVILAVIGNAAGILMPRFMNIKKGYTTNGFVYAFACSMVESGVDEPENFSEDSLEGILAELKGKDDRSEQKPNVVFVQLESFVDPDIIKGLNLNETPIPNFRRIADNGPSGKLTVPVVGGGTANTEFEMLTGMSLDHFGTVEYPYETHLDDRTFESAAYNYKALGYKAHAIHNFSAGFYMRNEVFRNLGFDTFTSFEYMSDMEYNDIGWAKDAILERYIMSALESTEEKDYVYAISVQGHGSYPNDFDDAQGDINATVYNEDIEEFRESLYYYISQINEMDEFIGNLTERLSNYDEPTVVVFYGDHLPGINFSEEMLETQSLFVTEYAVWANYPLEAEDKDLCTYQLSAHVQKFLGYSSGKLTKFHQIFSDNERYKEFLQMLEYDIIEGDMLTYGGENPFLPSDMKYGVEDIVITGVEVYDESVNIKGINFNDHSSVYVNGSKKSTEYVDSQTLMIDSELEDGDIIFVAQMNYQMPWGYLSACEEYVYEENNTVE